MNTRYVIALSLLATPAIARAQTSATDTAPAQTAPNLPPPPPGAGPDGAPPPATTQQAPYTPVYPQQQPAYGQPYGQPAYGQAPYGQPLYGQSVNGGGYPGYGLPMRRVVPYHGGPIPRGATLETRRSMGLVIGGAVVFGGLYVLSILEASGSGGFIGCTVSCGAEYLYIPLVGPFVTMATGTHPTGDQVVLALDGIFQAAGVVGFIVGMLHTSQVVVFPGFARNDRGPQWMLSPGAPGSSLGATLTVTRF